MDKKIAIVTDVPTCAYGLDALLSEAGYEPFQVDRQTGPGSWAAMVAAVFVVTDLRQLDLVRAVRTERPEIPIITLMAVEGTSAQLDALRSGAISALSWDTSRETILRAVEAAFAREGLLSGALVRALASGAAAAGERIPVDESEAAWLRKLYQGVAVSKLAVAEGYSEREMFRRLSGLYRRMGAANRYQAITLAVGWGLLEQAELT
jgi:DNA-binding NarL/FixJ family response regulator